MYKAFIIFIITLSSVANGEEWVGFRGNSNRNNQSEQIIQLPLQTEWVHRPTHKPSMAWSPPAWSNASAKSELLVSALNYDNAHHIAANENRVYYASSTDDSVHCIDATNGSEVWIFSSEGPMRLAPTLANDKLYASSDDGHAYCLNASTGKLIWKYSAIEEGRRLPGNGRMMSICPVRGGIAVDNGTLYFAAGLFPKEGVYLVALNAESGEEIWKTKTEISPQGYLLLSEKHIFVPTGRTPFRVYNRENGEYLQALGIGNSWGKNLKGGSFGILDNDQIVTGPSEDGSLHFFNLTDLKKEAINLTGRFFKKKRKEKIFRLKGKQTSLTNDTIFLLNETNLRALSRTPLINSPETVKWEIELEDANCMLLSKNHIVVGANQQISIHRINDGKQEWSKTIEGEIASLAMVKGKIYASTTDGNIHSFNNQPLGQKSPIITAKDIANHSNGKPSKRNQKIIDELGKQKGYALILGIEDGSLALELAEKTLMNIICVEQDKAKIVALKKTLHSKGLYGARISVHNITENKLPYPQHFANFVSSELNNPNDIPWSIDEIKRVTRPSGGVIRFCFDTKHTNNYLENSKNTINYTANKQDDFNLINWLRPSLPGSGAWSHFYANAGNTSCSGDTTELNTSTIRWFGRPGPDKMIDRHQRSTPPLYNNGHLYITGRNYIASVDAYNGTIYWEKSIAFSARSALMKNCGNMVAGLNSLYLAHGNQCSELNAKSGVKTNNWKLETRKEWAYISSTDSRLIGSSAREGSTIRPSTKARDHSHHNWISKITFDNIGPFVCSTELFSKPLNNTGSEWNYKSDDAVIINTTIAHDDETLYFIESKPKSKQEAVLDQFPIGDLLKNTVQIIALDITSGKPLWKQDLDLSHIAYSLYLSLSDGIIIINGTRADVPKSTDPKSKVKQKIVSELLAFEAKTGKPIWNNSNQPARSHAMNGAHGELDQHPAIVAGVIYGSGYARKLHTGEPYKGWIWSQSNKCTSLTTSATNAFSRDESMQKLSYIFDLESGDKRPLSVVARPGCATTIIPAGSLVMIPESSSGCTCDYSIQSSIVYGQ